MFTQREKINTDFLINNIVNKKEIIFSKLKLRIKDVEKYFYIKKQYEKRDIKNNLIFQRVYKQFYKMYSAGLSKEFLKEYFRILSNREKNLKIILRKLYQIPRRNKTRAIHFAFTTKLLHTINNDLPIYDKWIGKFFMLKVTGNNKEEKINSCSEAYNQLKRYYKRLLSNKKIKNIILEARKKFNWSKESISDVKILDFIIWAKGQLKNN